MSRTRYVRPIAFALAVLNMAACKTWQPTTVSPRALIEEEAPSSLRVQRTDGEWQTISRPVLEGDSIAGQAIVTLGTSSRSTFQPIRLALAEIRGLEVKRFSALATIGAAVVLPVVAITVVARFVCSGQNDDAFC